MGDDKITALKKAIQVLLVESNDINCFNVPELYKLQNDIFDKLKELKVSFKQAEEFFDKMKSDLKRETLK